MELSVSDPFDPIIAGQAKGADLPPEDDRRIPGAWRQLPRSGPPAAVQTFHISEESRRVSGEGARYAPDGFNWRAFAVVVAIHAAVAVALLGMGVVEMPRPQAKHLTVVDLRTPPPTTPPQPQPQPEAQLETAARDPQPVAVKPMIELPSKSPMIVQAAVAQPAVTVRIDAPPAPSAPPAPPAPITPPDFSAAQLNNPGPTYPYASRRNREEGTALLKVLVTPEGRAGKIEIRESSGFERLDKAAIDTVRKWRFVPAQQAGQPVAAWVLVPIGFTLS